MVSTGKITGIVIGMIGLFIVGGIYAQMNTTNVGGSLGYLVAGFIAVGFGVGLLAAAFKVGSGK